MGRPSIVIMILLIVTFFGFGIIIPILPDIVSAGHLAFMLAVYSAASFIMSPIWGSLSDRIGRRPILMIGAIGFSISFLIFGLAVDHIVWMYISRVLGGIFSGALTACAVAYIADITNDEDRTKGMGLVGMSIGLGFIFGPAVGGLLSVYGHAAPFFISSALSFGTFLLIIIFLKESLAVDQRTLKGSKRPSRWTAFHGMMKYLYTLGFIVSLTLAGLETVLMYFQREKFGATSFDFGMMLLISGVVGALVQGGFVRRRIKKGEEPRYIALGLILSAAGFFLLLLSENFFTASLYLSVFAVGNALLRPCVTSLITQKTKVGKGVATGLSSSMDSLGRIVGPLLGAAVYYIHLSLPFIFGGVICLAALMLLKRFSVLDQETTR